MSKNLQTAQRYGAKVGAKEKMTALSDTVRRAFGEFLTLPTVVIACFLVLAFITYGIDRGHLEILEPIRAFLRIHIFYDAQSTGGLLGAIAAGIISVTSLTITLLLIVVQQSASSMTTQVFDQFLRRKTNQFCFGFFIGLALYSLITLATVNEPFNPVFGGSFAFLLTVAALYLLIVLLYTTINQMRPVEIIEAIHNHLLESRECQQELIRKTRRTSQFAGKTITSIRSPMHGYVTRIDIKEIGETLKNQSFEAEIELKISIGAFVAFEDVVAEVRTTEANETKELCAAILSAIRLKTQREIDNDPAYGILQLEMIGWTSMSTAKSNPGPGLQIVNSLRDVMARWCLENEAGETEKLPIVYTDDVAEKLFSTLETFAVVASESMQHQILIAVINTLRTMFDRMPPEWQNRMEDVVLRMLSVLGEFVLTAALDEELTQLAAKFDASGRNKTAEAVRLAHKKFALSVGKLNSRSTRVPVG